MKGILALLFSLFTIISFSQEMDTTKWELIIEDGDTIYYRKDTPGDILFQKGKIDEAIEYYKNDFIKDPDDKFTLKSIAQAYAISKQRDSAFYYMDLAHKNDSSIYPITNSSYYFLTEDPRWKEFEDNQIAKVEKIHGKYENLELSKKLWRMKMIDQAFYYHLDVIEENLGRKSVVNSAIWETKRLLNEKNLADLNKIIDEYGWPKKSDVGGNAAGSAFLIVQHANIETQKKYLPFMKEAAENGEAEWGSLALLIDRVNLREGKKQIYGSQIGRKDDGTYFVSDLEEPEFVNQRRKEVGLGPIEEYAKRWGIVWDVEQKEK